MNAPARIETPRLVLAMPDRADAADIFGRYASDADVTRYLGWPRHERVEDTGHFLDFSAAEWMRWPAGPYLIRSRADGVLLGSTGLAFEGGGQAMTGYVLAKDAWGRGYATEALSTMVDLARALGISRVYALCHPVHHASVRVLEKCGFTLDAGSSRPMDFPNLDGGVRVKAACYRIDV